MRAVIFDRDGVIIDSESINIESAIKAFEKLGVVIKDEEKNLIIGRHPDDYKEFFLEKYSFSYKKFKEIQKKIYSKMLELCPLFKDTIYLIKKLHEMKVMLALTTSSEAESTQNIIKRAGLERVFDVVVTFEDCKKRKPEPEPYLLTAKKMGLAPEECVVIEDSFVGVEAAKNAGMKCIVISNGHTKNQDFPRANLIVDSAKKINISLLKSI